MKIRFCKEQGSVLAIVIILGAVVGILLGGYLVWASQHNVLMLRSQAWNKAIPVLEAGIEEALAHLHDFPDKRAANGWILSADKNYHFKNRNMAADSRYSVFITNVTPPIIVSHGFVRPPLRSGQKGWIHRGVRVETIPRPLFSMSIAMKDKIDMNGTYVLVDSFDSTNNSESTNGRYDVAKRTDRAKVSSNSSIFNVGNADIYGKVAVGAGGTVSVGPTGGVGSKLWHAGNYGIEPGSVTYDANVSFPTIDDAPTSGSTPQSGTNYQYVLGGGTYDVSQLSGGAYVSADSTLIVRDTFSIDKTKQIVLAPNVTLTVYCYAATASINNEALVNPGTAKNFLYFGMPSNTSVKFSGAMEFTGVIYAPEADIKMGGGGNAINFQGACMGKSLTLGGNLNMHYDESLNGFRKAGYIVVKWDEI